MKIITFVILTFAITINAHAYFYDGNGLVVDMREFEKALKGDANANYQDASQFRGYVVGIFDSLDVNDKICEYDNLQQGQVAEVVIKYLNDYPEKRGKPAYNLVKNALVKAFPCN